ncbi:MAG: glycosyltransferase [Luteolibacter sp.]
MRIEFVTDTFAPDINGVAMTLGRLRDGLRARGHRVQVVHTGLNVGRGERSAAALPLPGYPEVRVGLPKPFEFRARWLARRPDVVYIATESLLGKSALKAANAIGIPVVSGFHTNFQDYMHRYRLGLLRPLAISYLRRFHQRANHTVVPSQEVKDLLVAEGVERVHVLGRGVDISLFDPAMRCETLRRSWGADESVPVVAIVGRVAAEKNFELAMAAIDRMKQEVPELCCIVVGDGPLRAKLEAQCRGLHFVGMRTGEDLARHYASADVLLFPSETETFGNVLLEGMASGLACVSYDYAAAQAHVEHGFNGLKVPKGNEQAFIAEALRAMRMRPDHPLRLAARRSVEPLGWEEIIHSLEDVFNEVVTATGVTQSKVKSTAKRQKLSCRTVFLSDIHLGTRDSKADEVVDFLKHIDCRKLVLNGDIIDGWALRRGGQWTSRHSRVIRKILKMTERDDTQVVYLRGNHDEILERFMPLAFGSVSLVKEHIHLTPDGKRYLVIHGDGFDSVSTNHKWLAIVGAVGYDLLLRVNRIYNLWRSWRGKEYYSISKQVKARVKSAVCFADRYEDLLRNLARKKNCEGIICGHIHTPEDRMAGGVHYLNSGDWVESLTAIIEHHDGRMELVRYKEFIESRRTLKSEKTPSFMTASTRAA